MRYVESIMVIAGVWIALKLTYPYVWERPAMVSPPLPEGTWLKAVERRWGGTGNMPVGPIGH